LGATRGFEVDEPTTECGSEVVCASRDASNDINDGPTNAVVGIGCTNASLDRWEGEPNLVCSNDMGLLMTIDGTRDGAASSGFDMMALPMSLVSHRPVVQGMILRNLRERVI
jgi:hypothetical protein